MNIRNKSWITDFKEWF